MSKEEFAGKYGAHPDDIGLVAQFARESGFKVLKTHLGRRTVEVSASAAHFCKAFGVTLGRYEHTVPVWNGKKEVLGVENYRGRDGFINTPRALAKIVVGVFGLDNRNVTKRCGGADPANSNGLTIAQLKAIYNFPTNSAFGETIGIMSPTAGHGGYLVSDFTSPETSINPTVAAISADGTINGSLQLQTSGPPTLTGGTTLYFNSVPSAVTLGSNVWCNGSIFGSTVIGSTSNSVTIDPASSMDIEPGTTIDFNVDSETNQDIWIAALAASDANIAVYFSAGEQAGWVAMVNRAIHPENNDPECSVLSSSFFFARSDDKNDLASEGITQNLVTAVSAALADAAIFGRTFCIASGDWGSSSGFGDSRAHVAYPSSDPSVLSVGGTTVGYTTDTPPVLQEFVWNDAGPVGPQSWGTTGGGVSDFFPLPLYQATTNIPMSANGGTFRGRGIPDVAAVASSSSPILGMFYFGVFTEGAAGTSASAPLWAALIAVINAALEEWVGFINPAIYTFGSSVFQDVNPPPGPTNNANSNAPGYNAGPGWDACTGWGSPNGVALLAALRALPSVYITGGYQSPDIVLTNPQTGLPVLVGNLPGATEWYTVVEPGVNYRLSATIHNDSVNPVSDVQVSFWAIPGGLGVAGPLLDTVSAITIPPLSRTTVKSTVPFTVPRSLEHLCAAVSIYSPGTGCTINATTSAEIPDPGLLGDQRCSAWRNTMSLFARGGSRVRINLGGVLEPKKHQAPQEIQLRLDSRHVPFEWSQGEKPREIARVLRNAGAQATIPLYLLPEVRQTLAAIDLKPELTRKSGGKVSITSVRGWSFQPSAKSSNFSFKAELEIPKSAHAGDVILALFSADYPNVGMQAARTVEFLAFIHVE